MSGGNWKAHMEVFIADWMTSNEKKPSIKHKMGFSKAWRGGGLYG